MRERVGGALGVSFSGAEGAGEGEGGGEGVGGEEGAGVGVAPAEGKEEGLAKEGVEGAEGGDVREDTGEALEVGGGSGRISFAG